MLDQLKIRRVSLMTNNPKKLKALKALDIDVVSRTPIDHGITEDNKKYIATKRDKLGHAFDPHIMKE